MVTVRCIISLAVQNDWPLFQMDINNAFLYGELTEDVYMTLPLGYFSKEETRVCKLSKSLYGLKQAPRQWHQKLTITLLENGFIQSKNDFSMYTKTTNNAFLILLVYVDDIIITGNNLHEINQTKTFLSSKFMIKDLGKLKYFLGIEILETENGLCMSQRKYCLELLSDFGLLGCKPLSTPIEQNIVINTCAKDTDQLLTNITEYQRMVGKLIYLTLTRPDISYVVHCLSQFMHAPLESHLKLAIHVMRYLKQSPGKGVAINKSDSLKLKAFVDADWGKCLVGRKSVTGFGVFLGDNLISWKSKKQNTVSRSSTEAEYRAMASVTAEVIWTLKLLDELKIPNLLPVNILCDNKSAIQIASNPVFHERTKHFEIDLHFIREKISAGVIKTIKVESSNNTTNIFTKGLNKTQHNFLSQKPSLKDMFQSTD